MFTFYKRTTVSWEHYNGIVKVGFGGGIPVFDHTANTFIFQTPNGKNYPKEAVVVNADLKIIDQTDGDAEYTFLTTTALENKLVELGYPFIELGASGVTPSLSEVLLIGNRNVEIVSTNTYTFVSADKSKYKVLVGNTTANITVNLTDNLYNVGDVICGVSAVGVGFNVIINNPSGIINPSGTTTFTVAYLDIFILRKVQVNSWVLSVMQNPINISAGGGGGLTSFNGRTAPAVVPTSGDYTTALVTEVTNKKYVTDAEKTAITHSNRTILDLITEAFTTTLKTAYDSAVTWISTNGANVLSHLASTSNPHSVTKSQVGLGDVDNTSDVNKPVSTAQQVALDAKQATLVSATNIKTINGSSVLGAGDLVVTGAHSPFLTQQVDRVALTANTSAQDIFDVNSGGVTLEVNSTYEFHLSFTMTGLSGTAGTIGLFFGGTSSITNIHAHCTSKKAGLSSTSTPNYTFVDVTTGVVITSSNTTTTASATVYGRVVVTTAGTFKPQVNMSVGATAVVKSGSILTMRRLGSNTDTNG